MKKRPQHANPGPPREFDPEAALEKALQVFWEKGYEGASLTDLTKAMGINRPSMYATFGNKEELFAKAFERYTRGPACFVVRALEESDARTAIVKLLQGAIGSQCSADKPRGWLAVHGALACGDESARIRQELARARQASQAAICERLKRAKKEGDLPAGFEPEALSAYIATVLQGMAVQSSGGATREQLEDIARVAMQVWPEEKTRKPRSSNGRIGSNL